MVGSVSLGTSTALGAGNGPDPRVERARSTGTTQVVTVDAPTRAARTKVTRLGLDVTESADRRGIDVVLHGAKDAAVLRKAGFTWTVKVKDLAALERRTKAQDEQYAASVATSPLPSGQDHYRTLADYNREMRALARQHPDLVRLIRLKHRSLQGRPVYGIELTRDVRNLATASRSS